MKRCKKCSHQLARKNIIRSAWGLSYNPIICDNCSSEYHISLITRLIIGIAITTPLFRIKRLYSFKYFSYPLLINFLIYVVWVIILIYTTPFYAKYYLKDREVDSN